MRRYAIWDCIFPQTGRATLPLAAFLNPRTFRVDNLPQGSSCPPLEPSAGWLRLPRAFFFAPLSLSLHRHFGIFAGEPKQPRLLGNLAAIWSIDFVDRGLQFESRFAACVRVLFMWTTCAIVAGSSPMQAARPL